MVPNIFLLLLALSVLRVQSTEFWLPNPTEAWTRPRAPPEPATAFCEYTRYDIAEDWVEAWAYLPEPDWSGKCTDEVMAYLMEYIKARGKEKEVVLVSHKYAEFDKQCYVNFWTKDTRIFLDALACHSGFDAVPQADCHRGYSAVAELPWP